jgi:hypothetical protein
MPRLITNPQIGHTTAAGLLMGDIPCREGRQLLYAAHIALSLLREPVRSHKHKPEPEPISPYPQPE